MSAVNGSATIATDAIRGTDGIKGTVPSAGTDSVPLLVRDIKSFSRAGAPKESGVLPTPGPWVERQKELSFLL